MIDTPVGIELVGVPVSSRDGVSNGMWRGNRCVCGG